MELFGRNGIGCGKNTSNFACSEDYEGVVFKTTLLHEGQYLRRLLQSRFAIGGRGMDSSAEFIEAETHDPESKHKEWRMLCTLSLVQLVIPETSLRRLS